MIVASITAISYVSNHGANPLIPLEVEMSTVACPSLVIKDFSHPLMLGTTDQVIQAH